MNRLAEETSPYLRQHRDNPVDWYPWGEKAFERARTEDKPILLSVGYAACHWCHVMAHESFEDPGVAEVMNRLFVNVKVDREERPDVDAVYMEAVQAMSGHGGWPMTVFMTPDGQPFYGGTYFPKLPRQGMPGFIQLCENIAAVWRDRRDEIVAAAGKVTGMLQGVGQFAAVEGLPERELVRQAAAQLVERADRTWGGFGNTGPKFPQPDLFELLLRVGAGLRGPNAVDVSMGVLTDSLDAMASGGIYDHAGGGFHRYSVDRQWLVPHFEKMLYDQAGLARVYLHAWQATGAARWLQVASETIDYVRRDLRHPEGGFFSSEDADSEGVEGKFYVWDMEDVPCEARDWYGVTERGNFEGANILVRTVRGDLVRPADVESARQSMFEAREKRVRPGLDDKVLTEWNGLFVATLAEAAAATGREDWLADACTAGDFLLHALRRHDGRFLRSWKDGRAQHLGYAADYAALVGAFTRLAEATGGAQWIGWAREVADAMLDLFWDEEGGGGLFTAGKDGERLITRAKDVLDNVIPSANGSAAVALVRLAALTGEERYREKAEGIIRLVADPMGRHPTAFAHLLAAVDLIHAPVTEVAVVGDRPDLVRAVQSRYLPNAVLAWGEPYGSPLFEFREEGLAYVCQNYACQRPTGDVDELVAQLAL